MMHLSRFVKRNHRLNTNECSSLSNDSYSTGKVSQNLILQGSRVGRNLQLFELRGNDEGAFSCLQQDMQEDKEFVFDAIDTTLKTVSFTVCAHEVDACPSELQMQPIS